MSKEKSNNLSREVKNFIDETQNLMTKNHDAIEENDLNSFAEKIWSLNHFSNELLSESNLDESVSYNARIIKDLTESPIYPDEDQKEACSLLSAADHLKKEKQFKKLKSIMCNLISDQMASEVLLDDLMVIYKELCA